MAETLYDNELTKKLLMRAIQHLQSEAESYLDNALMFELDPELRKPLRVQFESPLEAGFWAWWLANETASNLFFNYWTFHFNLFPQYEVKWADVTYRLDFAIFPDSEDPHVGPRASQGLDVPQPKFGIELDGHDFHEKTKEQVTYRNQRDRLLQQWGWTIFHFSGSEFVKHPLRCIEEVVKAVQIAYGDYASALIKAREARQTGLPSNQPIGEADGQ